VRVLNRAIILACAVLLILFAVSNRETVSLALWPLPFLLDAPLYLFFFLSLLVGGLLGASAAWLAGRHDRRELRRRRRRIDALERELSATQSRLADSPRLPPPALPAKPAGVT
jgi:lipopolysaccharide assembly protein A